MKQLLIALAILFGLSTVALAEDKTKTLEERVLDLEKSGIDLPDGMFISGEIEGRYDDKQFDAGWEARSELQVGFDVTLPDNDLNIDYAGASMTYDSDYSLDSTKDNTMVEKQLGLGNDFATIYLGETDAQRLGFAKTAKIGAPIIITEKSNRLDHNNKTVITFGGFERDSEFDFDTYRLKKEQPYGFVLGYDANEQSTYASATVSLMGYADVSYMMIDTKADGSANYTVDTTQEGYSIGGSLFRFGVPMTWGAEMWDDKDTGLASDNRIDVGAMYFVNESVYVTAHRTENDDLGYDGNYYGVVYNVVTNRDPNKRADKQDGLEVGLYLHDKSGASTFTGVDYAETRQVLGSIRYKF